ncbi:MAG: hypothetical protein ACI9EW_000176 [Cellvibrionaceae bacterium]|jgi:hypothetical protein
MKVEEEYQDVLMNIEFAILGEYRNNRDLRDYDIDVVINTAIRYYDAQRKQKVIKLGTLSDQQQQVYDSLFVITILLLNGFSGLQTKDGQEISIPESRKISVEVLILCLKRIRKSVKLWTKRNGPKGYLTFLDTFLSESN